jgi:hypothetical protein
MEEAARLGQGPVESVEPSKKKKAIEEEEECKI